ncbi:MAG TPA: acyl-CoA dehydrogenase family protein [Rhodoblastus sp.]|nr:acyl-CoA dehydrogenase family protein [Rhodoblastus sp.]
MISFAPTEEQRLVCDIAAEFAAKTLAPAARAADEGQRFSGDVLDRAWALGLISNLAADEDALKSQPALLNVQALEQLAHGDAAVAMALAGPLGFVKAIAEKGSDRQKELLQRFAGDIFCAAAVAHSDVRGGPEAVAQKTSDGYELSACKSLVPFAARCDNFLVTALCDSAPEAFIVSRGMPGVSVDPPCPTLGLRALEMADVRFDRVLLPRHARLGEDNGSDVSRIVDGARTALSAILTGLSSAVFTYALPYTQERVVHGEPIARKQSVAFKLADMHLEIEAMRWMTWKAADELDKGRSARKSASLARRYCASRAMTIADEGVQIFGGHGFVRDMPLEMWFRNARALSVLDGLVGA